MKISDKHCFIGIGAQKAGTTWLANYLNRHPQVCFSPLKELHFFDTRFVPELAGHYDGAFAAGMQKILQTAADGGDMHTLMDRDPVKLRRCLLKRVEMNTRPEAYLEYFEELLGDELTFGEISPGYDLLNEEGFIALRNTLPGVKLVYVLRNPVERYWSHLKHHSRSFDGFSPAKEFEARLSDAHFYRRTDYATTLRTLGRVFSPDEVMTLFYEDVFFGSRGADELEKLTDFLGIDAVAPDLDERIHASPVNDMPEPLRTIGARHFKPIYRAMHEMFESRLPPQWLRDMARVGLV